jgi:hypothetical protein
VVECLLDMREALGSISNMTKNKKRKKEKKLFKCVLIINVTKKWAHHFNWKLVSS